MSFLLLQTGDLPLWVVIGGSVLGSSVLTAFVTLYFGKPKANAETSEILLRINSVIAGRLEVTTQQLHKADEALAAGISAITREKARADLNAQESAQWRQTAERQQDEIGRLTTALSQAEASKGVSVIRKLKPLLESIAENTQALSFFTTTEPTADESRVMRRIREAKEAASEAVSLIDAELGKI